MRELPRVLHVVASLAPRYGGPSASTVHFTRALAAKGLSVTIMTTNVDGPDRLGVSTNRAIVEAGVRVVYADVPLPNRYAVSPMFARQLRGLLNEVDLIHIHGIYSFTSVVAAALARRYNVPYILRPHGSLDPFLQSRNAWSKRLFHEAIGRKMLDAAAAIHYTTEQERMLATWTGTRAPSFVLPLGLDMSEFSGLPTRGEFRAMHPQFADRRLILFLGRINFKKGLDLLVDAFQRLDIDRLNAHLLFVGPDTEGYARRIKRLVADYRLDDRVTFLPMVVDRAKLAILTDSDVFVLPSHSENFGLAVIEAMACRLPVVISDQVNICDEVNAHRAGMVVPLDADALARAIRHVLTDCDLATAIATNGFEFVRQHYDWSSLANMAIGVYRHLIIGNQGNIE